MALDPAQLQLILNVVAITGLTSLALICLILKRDKEKLAAEISAWRNRPAPPVSVAPKVMTAPDGDIRQFVTRRMQDWLQIQEAGTKI